MILETPWIGKDKSQQRPMYEAEIALLRGNAAERFGGEFLEDVERLAYFFGKKESDHRELCPGTWECAEKRRQSEQSGPREPMERLYDMVHGTPDAARSSSEEKSTIG